MEVIVVRHGETEYNIRNLVNSTPTVYCPLTAKGRQQAIELGPKLRKLGPIDAIFTSRLPRTIETLRNAIPFAEFSIDRYLDEVNVGICESQCHSLYKQFIDNSVDKKPPGGESFMDVVQRFKVFYGLQLHKGYKRILVIGHADTVRAAQVVLNGIDPHHAKFSSRPENCVPYVLSEEIEDKGTASEF